jgi:hypothetical protein
MLLSIKGRRDPSRARRQLRHFASGDLLKQSPREWSESDLRAMQLPLLGEIARFEEPGWNYLVSQSPKGIPSAFVCDSPDEAI